MHGVLVSFLLVVFASHGIWARSLERLASSSSLAPIPITGSRKNPSTWQLASFSKESQLHSNEAEIKLLTPTPLHPVVKVRSRRSTFDQQQPKPDLRDHYVILPDGEIRETTSQRALEGILETRMQKGDTLRHAEKDEMNPLGLTELLLDLLVGYVEQQLSKRGTVAADLAPVSTTAQPATVDIKTLPGYWLRDPTMAEPESSLPVDYRTEHYSLDDLLTTKGTTSTAPSPS